MQRPSKIVSSFRDPSGFVFEKNGILYRQINKSYQKNYEYLESSGLLQKLTEQKLLISHEEVENKEAYKIIKPEKIPFISYPYEWCFDELKDAALLTLKIQKIALEHGMSLKDASAFNIQFFKGKPILIDTLSFEIYPENKPWIAYHQFCQHFLAPLSLMSYVDLRLGDLLSVYLDGIPLDFAARLLPLRTKFSVGLGTHLHLHAHGQKKYSDRNTTNSRLGKNQLLGILANLETTILSLKLPKQNTRWENYYKNTNYSLVAKKHKEGVILKWIKKVAPKLIWDSGANDGTFGRLASSQKINTIATDIDQLAIESAYLTTKKTNDQFFLPLIVDLTNPSPALGLFNKERPSFMERSSFDLTLCLALMHHLAISHNMPFSYIARLYADHTKNLIIEFVPKSDSNAKLLLQNREDIFENYDKKSFEKEFLCFFDIKEEIPIKESSRILYLMERK